MPLGKIYNLTPAKFKSFSSPVCSHNMNNTDKPTDFQEDGSYFQRRRSSFSHTRARILQYDINPASFIKDFPLKRWMPYYYSMRISRLMQTMLFRNFFNFLFSSLIIFRFFRRSFYLFSFVFSLSGASLPLTLPHLFFFSTNYKNTHVCEKKRPGSAASASEVFLRSLPFFILPFFAFPLLLSILFPIFVR